MTTKKATLAMALAAAAGLGAGAWTLAGDEKENAKETDKEAASPNTYTPSVEEWLQVSLNALFGRHDSQREIGFLVMPGTKRIKMTVYISRDHPSEGVDGPNVQRMRKEAESFEQQARKYAKRFDFEIERQEVPGS